LSSVRSWKQAVLGRARHKGPLPEKLGEGRYSQGAEELLITRFFADRRGGVFVDVGAGDWRTGSTTYWLECHLGWSGIAVDALAEHAEGYRVNRPSTTFFNYIVTDHSGTSDPFYVAGCLSTTKRKHLEGYAFVDAAQTPVIRVPAITLTELLDAAGVARIDLLSMDIEQSEPAALAGFAISRFKPRLVCVEVGTDEVRRWVTPYFAAAGYERIEEYLPHDIGNWYFRRPARSVLGRLVRRSAGGRD
jgi:FkbM family methyltransferase